MIRALLADTTVPLSSAHYVCLAESMSGGGGPACLRLRVSADEITGSQLPLENQLTEALLDRLRGVIEKWYPDELTIDQLANVEFVEYLAKTDQALESAFWAGRRPSCSTSRVRQ